MKKQNYEKTELEIILLQDADVIATSSPYGGEGSWGDWTPERN